MVNGGPLRHVWWSGRSLYARGAIFAAALLAAAVLGAGFLTAVRGRPCLRVLQEASHFLDLGAGEIAALLGDAQRVPPGGQGVQLDPLLGQRGNAFGADAVVEDNDGNRKRVV